MIPTMFLILVVLLILGVPISAVLVLAASAAVLTVSNFNPEIVAQQMFTTMDKFPLLAIPFFILAGNIMAKGGMSDRLIALASSMIGRMRGGLAAVCVLACMFFASVCGSTAATTAAIGIVIMPALIRSGFSPAAATGLQATSGSIGIIIPPSIPLVLMGVIGGISIGELFLAGVVPGILMGVALITVALITARVQRHEISGEPWRINAVLRATWRALLPLATIVVVIGGILMGWVTPTEAAILAVVWALLVSGLIYRALSLRDLMDASVDTVRITGVVVLCIGATAPFAWLLTIEQVPQTIADALLGWTQNPVALKLLMAGVLLLIGTFLDLTPAMLLMVPIFQPIARMIGMDDVQFGLAVVMALAIGQCTPPVGIALFVACGLSKVSMTRVTLPLLPYILAMILVLILVLLIPGLTLWLPQGWVR